MSAIWVVRHGQASFLADNYDRLSPLGERQSRLLGDHWLQAGVTFDQVYSGPAERQIRTGQIIAEAYREAGRPWPGPMVDPELDEFPAEDVFRHCLPVLLARHPHLAASFAEFQAATEFLPKQRAFDRLLREVSQRWMLGEVDGLGVPTWRDFCHRIEAAVSRIRAAAPKSSRIAVFTSGGPTAATARVALGLSYEATLELTWSPRNASVSEFLFTSGRFSLSTFNSTAHLPEASLLTYR